MATKKILTSRQLPIGNSTDFLLEVSKGKIEGHFAVNVFGVNEVVSTTTEDIWSPGGSRVWLTTPVTLEAISSSADDDASAGSGARTLVVAGLDGDFEPIVETIDMNGMSASSATQQSFIRVNRIAVATTGTYAAANAGVITVRTSGAGATQAEIANGVQAPGVSQQTHYTVKAGFTAVLFTIFTNVDSNFSARLSLSINQGAGTLSAPFSAVTSTLELVGVQGESLITLGIPAVITEKSDIWMKAVVPMTDAAVSGGFALMLVDNEFV